MLEGSEPPNPNRDSNQIAFERQKWTNGSFGMPLKPFIRTLLQKKVQQQSQYADGWKTFPFSIEQGIRSLLLFPKKASH